MAEHLTKMIDHYRINGTLPIGSMFGSYGKAWVIDGNDYARIKHNGRRLEVGDINHVYESPMEMLLHLATEKTDECRGLLVHCDDALNRDKEVEGLGFSFNGRVNIGGEDYVMYSFQNPDAKKVTGTTPYVTTNWRLAKRLS